MIIRNVVIADIEENIIGDELSWVWTEEGVIRQIGNRKDRREHA